MMLQTFKIDLRDGTPVLVRPVEANDQHLLELGLEHLSQQSRYNRFFRPITKLSKSDLEGFSSVDQINHIAVGALDLTHEKAYPIGVARCIRLDQQADEAEVAVAVIDSHQGKGLGTVLLAAVAHAAAERKVKRFVATVLSSNHSMLKLFDELESTRTIGSSAIVNLRIPIHATADDYPETPTGLSFKRVYELLG